ncbi:MULTISPECIES: hypothetical protein [unclassified Modestobacter]|uniref:hypothetical protein n=1 Tax=unclassified Modestobacter TaxID=2643866 RepID=UPI0022AA9C3D|nr:MULTISPECIES: hypothetical protein [unclassified Modestobacter]MCZ2824602.1 hypothetical protein [Modestobacter sp. VKM Ac-2981]MCZ2853870.1 hypothetical protein [Modestobacter sp. VKM Ac-2982]
MLNGNRRYARVAAGPGGATVDAEVAHIVGIPPRGPRRQLTREAACLLRIAWQTKLTARVILAGPSVC